MADESLVPTVDDDPSRLIKINLQTKAVTVLAKGIWGVMSLGWSPEASALAYSYGTKGSATLAALLVDDASVAPRILRQVDAADGPAVRIQGIRWSVPEIISFCEFVAAEETSLTIRQITADGNVTTARDFGTSGNDAMPLSNTEGGDGPWLLTDDEGLWLWQGGQKTKLLEDASEPAWSPAVTAG